MALPANTNNTVMVVDDSDDIRELICTHLRMLGYNVVEASNGQEAVDIARATHPGLIFMDIQMPVMDGLAATRLLRNMKELSDMAIVAFSAFGSGGNRQRALEAGCSDFVDKVIGMNQLVAIVQRFLPDRFRR
ncbi:MAG: response regulator [Pyrinomonadaceae bacterium]